MGRHAPAHPYTGEEVPGGLPYLASGQEEWDDRFPDHPLTSVRRTLARITPTITLADWFKQLPPF